MSDEEIFEPPILEENEESVLLSMVTKIKSFTRKHAKLIVVILICVLISYLIYRGFKSASSVGRYDELKATLIRRTELMNQRLAFVTRERNIAQGRCDDSMDAIVRLTKRRRIDDDPDSDPESDSDSDMEIIEDPSQIRFEDID